MGITLLCPVCKEQKYQTRLKLWMCVGCYKKTQKLEPRPQRKYNDKWVKIHEAQIAKIKSVEHILLSSEGSLDAVGKVLGITGERVRQIINNNPELHYLKKEVRQEARRKEAEELLSLWLWCGSPDILTVAKEFGYAETCVVRVRRLPGYLNYFKQIQLAKKQKTEQEVLKLVRTSLNQRKTVNAVIKESSSKIWLAKKALFILGHQKRVRRSHQEVKDLVTRTRNLIVIDKRTLTRSIQETELDFGRRIWLSKKIQKLAQEDEELALAIEENRVNNRPPTRLFTPEEVAKGRLKRWSLKDKQKLRDLVVKDGREILEISKILDKSYRSTLYTSKNLEKTDEEFKKKRQEMLNKNACGRCRIKRGYVPDYLEGA